MFQPFSVSETTIRYTAQSSWFFDQGFMSWDEEVRQIELFAKHIIPAFR
jgi:hypothetical protein